MIAKKIITQYMIDGVIHSFILVKEKKTESMELKLHTETKLSHLSFTKMENGKRNLIHKRMHKSFSIYTVKWRVNMSILDKFSEIKVDNSTRLSPEDLAHCKLEEKIFHNAYNAYLTAYNSVKTAFEEQKKMTDDELYGHYIYEWDSRGCGVSELRAALIRSKECFVGKITRYFNNKYHMKLPTECNPYSKYSYSDDLSIDTLTLENVLDEFVFSQLDGLTFSEYAINQAIDENGYKTQKWNKWYKKWNYEVKGKIIKFSYSIYELKPLLYFYDNNEIEVCCDWGHNKVDSITGYKNGNTDVKFLSAEYALDFAKKYLGYIEMSDEEREKLKDK